MDKILQKNSIKKILKVTILLFFMVLAFTSKHVSANDEQTLSDTTRVYFCSEVTKTYGNGDCILLENYDKNGNKIYGLIDTGRKILKNDENSNSSTVVKEFLKNHGVKKLEFLAITHSHGDHNGDALVVLDNFDIDTIYMKEFDAKWSPDGTQGTYEDIIEKAVSKNIKVIGVNFLSLTSQEISPSRSSDFINNTKTAKQELFESFYYNNDTSTNTIFSFGSATIQIFNWEMFDEKGNQYITGVTTNTTREIDTNENNNSLAFLLKQGNKKAFFAGDMNNLDEDKENGRIGDEDRLKDSIGKVDLLKLGHHGYQYSNTEDYINVLKPEYAVITNDLGGAYKDIANWLRKNKVNYLYTTSDEYGISATITNSDIFLGFETTGAFKNIDGTIYYIPEGNEYKYADYTKIAYKLKYEEKEVEVNSWNQLKETIESNKDIIADIDDTNKTCTLYKLIINMKAQGDWTATNTITVKEQQNIVLTTSENITALRGNDLKTSPLILLNGTLSIGTSSMTGKITFDGNMANVESSSTLISIENGTLNSEKNSILCNNMNKTTSLVKSSTTKDYTSFGSAIYSKNGNINITGGSIVNNSQDVAYTHTLPKEIVNFYRYNTQGTGIYMINNSILNMYSGKISNNEALNHSVVNTNTEYTDSKKQRGISQSCEGVGIYANSNSEVNLLGGEISGNIAKNYSTTTLKTATNNEKITNIYALNDGIYGVGVYTLSSKLYISNDFKIYDNEAELNSKITLEKNTSINSTANSGIRGLQGYINNSNPTIDGANISGGKLVNNTEIINNGKIGLDGTGSVSTTNCGGGLDIINNTTFNINNLSVNNCNASSGAGLYIQNSKGSISNSNITQNTSTGNGGGIWMYLSDVKISNTTVSENEAAYGGGIYTTANSSNIELDNIKISKNKSVVGSGGGIYTYGSIIISGKDTVISNNTAKTYGGGLMIKTKGIINEGVISDNSAIENSGGGIKTDGKLILNGGTVKNNTANTTGGGIDYTNGSFYHNAGTILNNTAQNDGNEIYPSNNLSIDTIKPTLTISEIPNTWTNENIIVTINASDEESDIKNVTINEEIISKNNGKYEYTVTTNGTYEVIATDNAGNTTQKSFTVAFIDKDAPIITGVTDNAIYNEDIIINAIDNLSGIKTVTLTQNGKKIDYTLGEKITDSGEYTIVVEDSVSNKSIINFKIDRALKNDEIVISQTNDGWTNQNKEITITVKNKIKSIKVNEAEVELVDGSYTITATNNNVYRVEIIDLDGNIITKTIEVSNIDKASPVIYGISEGKTYNEKVNLIIRDDLSGVSSIIITKDGQEKTYNEKEIEISENGKYQVKVIDNAGNEKIVNFIMQIASSNSDEITKGEDNIQDDIPYGENQEILNEKDDDTIATIGLPKAGNKSLVFGIMIIFIVSSLILYVKLKNYKDII